MLLSIIIPVYNRQEGLNKLLGSLGGQIQQCILDKDVEVIIIDDFSLVPVNISGTAMEVSVERNGENSGAPFSRSRGFQRSKGKFIHFHDSDDSISEQWLSEVLGELKSFPSIDILMTGRVDVDKYDETLRFQKYFHKHVNHPDKIKSRLVYRNCMGPLGGVVFSRRVIESVTFKPFFSCQDWQMYIDAVENAKVLRSRPDIHFIFNKTGDDRISHDARKKILGHSQLAKITAPKSPFKKSIRLFYLYTCKQHVFNKGGLILAFYKKNRLKIVMMYILVSVYWRLT